MIASTQRMQLIDYRNYLWPIIYGQLTNDEIFVGAQHYEVSLTNSKSSPFCGSNTMLYNDKE